MGMIKPLIYSIKEMFRRPKTIKYPYEKRDIAPRTRNMFTLDRDTCAHCGLCAKMCPNHVLRMVEGFPWADYRSCSYCTICMDACPKGSLQRIHIQEHGLVKASIDDFYMELLNPDGTAPGSHGATASSPKGDANSPDSETVSDENSSASSGSDTGSDETENDPSRKGSGDPESGTVDGAGGGSR